MDPDLRGQLPVSLGGRTGLALPVGLVERALPVGLVELALPVGLVELALPVRLVEHAQSLALGVVAVLLEAGPCRPFLMPAIQ